MTDTIKGPAWIPTFLAALAETGQVRAAARAAGIAAGTAYYQRNTKRPVAEAWQAALSPKEHAEVAAASAPEAVRGWRTCVLEALAETSNVTAAAIRANVPTRTVYKTRRDDPEFAARWLAAVHEGYDHLEMELLGYLRDPAPKRKMDVAGALRLLAAHRETVERRRALDEEVDEQAVLESIDRFIDQMRVRRAANDAILVETAPDDGAE